MRLTGLVVAAGLLWSTASVFPQTDLPHSAFPTGNDVLRVCSDHSVLSVGWCFGFLEGVTDAAQEEKLACTPQQIEGGQLKDVVMQHLTAHPETRHQSAAGEAMRALQAAFPCK